MFFILRLALRVGCFQRDTRTFCQVAQSLGKIPAFLFH